MRHREDGSGTDRFGDARRASHLLGVGHDLREGEYADQHRQELDSPREKWNAESESRHTHHWIVAEHRYNETQHARDQTF